MEAAKDELRLTVSAMVGIPENMQRSYLPLLHLHSVVLLITALNHSDDNQLASAIQAEYHFYDDVPLSGFALPFMESQALSAILAGQQEEGVTLMERAIALAREMASFGPLTMALLVQAMLVHEENPVAILHLEPRGLRPREEARARYCLVRALVGLIKTSPSPEDARGLLQRAGDVLPDGWRSGAFAEGEQRGHRARTPRDRTSGRAEALPYESGPRISPTGFRPSQGRPLARPPRAFLYDPAAASWARDSMRRTRW